MTETDIDNYLVERCTKMKNKADLEIETNLMYSKCYDANKIEEWNKHPKLVKAASEQLLRYYQKVR